MLPARTVSSALNSHALSSSPKDMLVDADLSLVVGHALRWQRYYEQVCRLGITELGATEWYERVLERPGLKCFVSECLLTCHVREAIERNKDAVKNVRPHVQAAALT